jgi:cation diffusion facilitator family transporter
MAEESKKVVYAALLGNVLVAVSKFGAAAISGSSAMLTEAIHSTADTANQILLLVGNYRSKRRKDATHAFGYGLEMYFWTFVVAVIVLLAGGVASIWEGVRQLGSPEPIKSPAISLGVLALSFLFEGASFAVGYRAYKRRVGGRRVKGKPVGMWRFIKISKDPNLYESLLEDSAALIGLGLAAAGVLASVFLGALWADGAASIAIGLLLIGCSLIIAEATRSLMAGETVAPPVLEGIRRVLKDHAEQLSVSEVKTLHLGPESILVALTIEVQGKGLAKAEHDLGEVTANIRALDERIRFVYFRLNGTP